MKLKAIGLLIVCTLLFGACAVQNSEKTPAPSDGGQDASTGAKQGAYHKITAEEAKKMMDEGGVTVVDVRRPEEYAEKHIPSAVLVPNETIGDAPPSLLPDKNTVLLVYCRTGVRSKQASDKLVKLGYTNVYDFGGIVDWPYETESGAFSEN